MKKFSQSLVTRTLLRGGFFFLRKYVTTLCIAAWSRKVTSLSWQLLLVRRKISEGLEDSIKFGLMEFLNPVFFYFSIKDTMEEIIFEMEIEMMRCNNFSVFVFLIHFFYSFYLMMFLLAPSPGFSTIACN